MIIIMVMTMTMTTTMIIIIMLITISYYPRARAVMRNIGPREWKYGPIAARMTKDQYSPVRLELAWLEGTL